jgi:hypothetical protein
VIFFPSYSGRRIISQDRLSRTDIESEVYNGFIVVSIYSENSSFYRKAQKLLIFYKAIN